MTAQDPLLPLIAALIDRHTEKMAAELKIEIVGLLAQRRAEAEDEPALKRDDGRLTDYGLRVMEDALRKDIPPGELAKILGITPSAAAKRRRDWRVAKGLPVEPFYEDLEDYMDLPLRLPHNLPRASVYTTKVCLDVAFESDAEKKGFTKSFVINRSGSSYSMVSYCLDRLCAAGIIQKRGNYSPGDKNIYHLNPAHRRSNQG